MRGRCEPAFKTIDQGGRFAGILGEVLIKQVFAGILASSGRFLLDCRPFGEQQSLCETAPLRSTPMIDPKFEVPDQVRDLALRTVEQAEKTVSSFIESASKSVAAVPGPMTELAKQALAISEKNFRHRSSMRAS
jgi:hypothetical protein